MGAIALALSHGSTRVAGLPAASRGGKRSMTCTAERDGDGAGTCSRLASHCADTVKADRSAYSIRWSSTAMRAVPSPPRERGARVQGSGDTIPISRHCAPTWPWPRQLHGRALISQRSYALWQKPQAAACSYAVAYSIGDSYPSRSRPTLKTGLEMRSARRVTGWRSGERLVFNQALALTKKPRNPGKIPRNLNSMLNFVSKLLVSIGRA